MSSRKIITTLGIAFIVAGLPCYPGDSQIAAKKAEEPVLLERNFTEGDSLRYKLKIGSQSGVKRTAFEQTISTQTEFKITTWILEVTEEEVALRSRFDHAVGSMSYGDMFRPVEAVAGLRGKELEITLKPSGEVVAWTGLGGEDYLEMGVGQLVMIMKEFFPVLPDTAVSPGDSWTEEYSIPSMSASAQHDYVGENTYTLKGFKTKKRVECAELVVVGTIIYEGRAEQAGEVWLMSGEGEVKGKAYVSLENGELIESKAEVKMTLEGEGQAVASAAASSVIEMGIKSKLEVELL